MIPVENYGLHQDGNLVFLLEHRKARCLTPGLSALPSPFEVVREDRTICPHTLYEPAPAELPADLHPLIEALAPVPSSGGAFWVPPDQSPAIQRMRTMVGGPQTRTFVPWGLRDPLQKLFSQLNLTNAAPLIITSYEPRDFVMLETLLGLPRIRTVVLCGALKLPGTEQLPAYSGPLDLNWPSIGAAMTERYVQQCLA
jgi:hypothetical protein